MLTSVLSCTASVLFVKRKFYADTKVKILLLWKSTLKQKYLFMILFRGLPICYGP